MMRSSMSALSSTMIGRLVKAMGTERDEGDAGRVGCRMGPPEDSE